MARYVTTEQYLKMVRNVMDETWFDDKNYHPQDIQFAIEYATQAVGAVLDSLDNHGEH